MYIASHLSTFIATAAPCVPLMNSSFCSIVPAIKPLSAAQLDGFFPGSPPATLPVCMIARFFPNRSHSVLTIFSFRFIAPGLDFMLFLPIPSSTMALLLTLWKFIDSVTRVSSKASANDPNPVTRLCATAFFWRRLERAEFLVADFSIFVTKVVWRAWILSLFLGWIIGRDTAVVVVLGVVDAEGREILERIDALLLGFVEAWDRELAFLITCFFYRNFGWLLTIW